MIYWSMDAYALIYALWLLRFTVKSRRSVSKWWPYFISFVFLAILLKYTLQVEQEFNPNTSNIILLIQINKSLKTDVNVKRFSFFFYTFIFLDVPWKTIYITKTLSITLYDDIDHRALLRPLNRKESTR